MKNLQIVATGEIKENVPNEVAAVMVYNGVAIEVTGDINALRKKVRFPRAKVINRDADLKPENHSHE